MPTPLYPHSYADNLVPHRTPRRGRREGGRRRIGFAMQDGGVDELATGSEFLVLQGRLLGLSRREAVRRAGVIGVLALAGIPLTIRNYRSVYRRCVQHARAASSRA
jgi:hypothetical protein